MADSNRRREPGHDSGTPGLGHRARQGYSRLEGFFRRFTDGMTTAEMRRLFEHDAAEAYAVLTRDQDRVEAGREDAGPEEGLRQMLERARVLFLGLSYKLGPARRALFALSMAAALLGLLPTDWSLGTGGRVMVDFSPLFFLASISGLVFLLALELVDRVRVRDELEVARNLQRDLLPRELILGPGYRAAHSYRTANEVGGDYYQMPVLPDGRIAVMVGDASGHGMAAGLLMAIADATVRTALDLDPAPRRVASIVNQALCRTGGNRAFFSFFYGLLEPASGRLEYVCAGHPFPILRRRQGELEELGRGGLPLGLRPGLHFTPGEARLRPGDLLVLYTDGLAEVQDEEGRAFGFERIQRLVAGGGSAQNVHDALLHAFQSHRGEASLTDDVTLVILERLPPLPAPPKGG